MIGGIPHNGKGPATVRRDDWMAWFRRINTMIISADSIPEMYRRLNVLESHGKGGWAVQKTPRWIDGKLRAVIVRIDPDR